VTTFNSAILLIDRRQDARVLQPLPQGGVMLAADMADLAGVI
jgi:hypothetical protein